MEGQDHNEMLRVGLARISKDIKDLKQEIRHELTALKNELKKEMKEEITTLQQEIERKLTDNANELQIQETAMVEAQERIAELEEWKTDTGEVMMEMLEQTRQMQEKVTDLEGSSRRNNIRIFGIPEEAEENSTSQVHGASAKNRATAPRRNGAPYPESTPRSNTKTKPECSSQVHHSQLSQV